MNADLRVHSHIFQKIQMAKSLKRIIRFTVCKFTEHTLPPDSNLPIMMEIRNLFRMGGSLADVWYKEKERKGRS